MEAILSNVKLSKKHIILLLVLMLFASLGKMLLPTLPANMIDGGAAKNSRVTIITLAIAMVVNAFVSCTANIISTLISALVSTKFAANIRTVLFDKVQDFPAAEMDRFGTASLVARCTSDVRHRRGYGTAAISHRRKTLCR